MFWNRITGPSNAGCVQASIFAPFWVLGNSGSICRAGAGNRSAFLGAKARFSLIYLTLEIRFGASMVLEYAPEFASSQHCDILEVWAGPVLMVPMAPVKGSAGRRKNTKLTSGNTAGRGIGGV